MSSKKKIIVIGNGMAGARLVEDVLARGGAEKFDFVVFGDEPYGNYNRILLSGVLSGTHDPKDIFINSLSWYQENNIRLHAGIRVTSIDRANKIAHGTDEMRKMLPIHGLFIYNPDEIAIKLNPFFTGNFT